MSNGSADNALTLESILRPLGDRASAELTQALVDLRLDEAAQRRYEELATKNTEATLADNEREELAEFVALNRFVSTLKAEAILAQRRHAA
ncbi:hypothetical protein CfE428DRAFT_3505 [Chthoniobacter flavus Ellin428]|uniref:Uncharacterized protein n=1 Tax=Chthoniobacter flavus Ellin428 TaxID=497964 RepID=B4D3L7_9BACT|nr:hypothetical protein [Chthoniobacter flavus]EDY18847.1 hypothetical protein CfE428DRAFT_3505 [Chthoniobacter flavus Ellin428]TCO93443.1 hypothetical protein EV701_104147 [Chthoniobacter flavus]